MTVIVFDGQTLAADKMSFNNGLIRIVTKIHKVNDDFIGISGDLGFCSALIDWYKNGANPKEYPEVSNKNIFGYLLVVTRDRQIKVYEHLPYPFIVENITYAM